MIVKYNDSHFGGWQEGIAQTGELYHDIRWRQIIKETYGLKPEYYVNISDVFEQKIEALRELAAQPLLVPMYTICALWRGMENGGKWSGCEYAEGFVRHARQPDLMQSPL